jgi:hypothetical protein
MLINLSNHPATNWQEKQKEIAKETYGTIQDLGFPAVPPEASKQEVGAMAGELFDKIVKIFDACANEPLPNAVHIQGEFTLVYALVKLLEAAGISCVASTSHRNVQTEGDKKVIVFEFVRFREY